MYDGATALVLILSLAHSHAKVFVSWFIAPEKYIVTKPSQLWRQYSHPHPIYIWKTILYFRFIRISLTSKWDLHQLYIYTIMNTVLLSPASHPIYITLVLSHDLIPTPLIRALGDVLAMNKDKIIYKFFSSSFFFFYSNTFSCWINRQICYWHHPTNRGHKHNASSSTSLQKGMCKLAKVENRFKVGSKNGREFFSCVFKCWFPWSRPNIINLNPKNEWQYL